MASNLPSWLGQILSDASIRLEPETPPNIKAFIDKVCQSPLQDIAIPLSGFHWEYNKGNFHHWRPLFHQFDTYFKAHVVNRHDLLLFDTTTEDDALFPKQAILQILRVMQIILEQCHNKSSFDGLEHFRLLLASKDPEVLVATLETLVALVKIPPSSKMHVGWSRNMIGLGPINSCLLSLAQGWGSKEEGLGMCSCVMEHKSPEDGLPLDVHDKDDKSQTRLGSTLYLELHGVSPQRSGESSDAVKSCSSNMIHMPDLHLRNEDDLMLLKNFIERYNVPAEKRFALLTRIRYARSFESRSSRILYGRICLLAFIVLVQSNDAKDELVALFANEPEYTNELIKIVRSEDDTISRPVKALATVALGAQLAACSSSHKPFRMLASSSINFAGGNWIIFSNVLQKAILSLKTSSDSSSHAFVEALLEFYSLHVISISSSGSFSRSLGLVQTLLLLLEDSDPAHMHLVSYAVITLQKLMDYTNEAVILLRDSGGVKLLAQRLQTEVQRVTETCSSSDEDFLCNQKRLIGVLLKALRLTTSFAANTIMKTLSSTLALILGNVDKLGGEIYFSAVTAMNEMIHNDPMCFATLHYMGLPEAFLSSVNASILPSAKVLTCVPSGLLAICLQTEGLKAVKEASALRFLFHIFANEKYFVAMNEAIVPLAKLVGQLLDNIPDLISTGVDIIIEIINKISSFGEGRSSGTFSEHFINLSIFHIMVLVNRIMDNTEVCEPFVKNSGIDALSKLLLKPSVTQSFEGMAIALHSTDVFKRFTIHHFAPLACALGSLLRVHLKQALTAFSNVPGSFLLDSKTKLDQGNFSSLFIVELVLFLAAAMQNKCMSALLTKFSDDNKDVLEDIGIVHRNILWQIAHLEDSKESQRVSSSSGIEEPRVTPFRQLLVPLLRRMNTDMFLESLFVDLYRGLGCASGLELDSAQKNYFSSYCDMVRSLAFHITHNLKMLGRSMWSDINMCRDKNISSDVKQKALTFSSICLKHIEFKGHSSTVSCRYLGKVMDFMDDICVYLQRSCNPVLLNCLYGQGVIQSVLTTFEATSQLLLTVPASPMVTDDGNLKHEKKEESESEHSWIYGSLASYGKLMDHLVTSLYTLSPFAKDLLVQSLFDSKISIPPDADSFVKVVQSAVLKVVLPVWTHSQFVDCSYDFISSIISIIQCIHSGVEVKSVSSTSSARLTGPPPNVEMGFTRARAEKAPRQVGSNSSELAMEETQEDDELTRAIPMSLGNSRIDANEEEMAQLPPIDELLLTCVKLLESKKSLAFPIQNLLMKMCSQGEHRPTVISFIIDQIKHCNPSTGDRNSTMLSALLHVLTLIIPEDSVSEELILNDHLVVLVDAACNCIRQQLPSELMRGVLQLCTILTQEHSGAISFLDAKGLQLLIDLPTSSLLDGNQRIAATIIHHILQVSETLGSLVIKLLLCRVMLFEPPKEDESGVPSSSTNIVFTLKLLSEILLTYACSVQVLLLEDAMPTSFSGLPEWGSPGCSYGELFRHILHKFVPYFEIAEMKKKSGSDWKHELADQASQFLTASCLQSSQARMIVFKEINSVFAAFVESAEGFISPGIELVAFTHVLNEVLSAQSDSCISSKAFIDVGLVTSLTKTLQVLDLDSTYSLSVVTGLINTLKVVFEQHYRFSGIDPIALQQPHQRLLQPLGLSSEATEEFLLMSSDDVVINKLTPGRLVESLMLCESIESSKRRGEEYEVQQKFANKVIITIDGKLLEAHGAPLVDTDALRGMIRLLQVVQEIDKGSLQKLLLNLCTHSETRSALVEILMEMLMQDEHKVGNDSPYRLYAFQSHVMYSPPHGVPPLVSSRVLETLTYLETNHPYVAYHYAPLLLGLLNQPLYLRSNAHLEQLLGLLKVTIDNVRKQTTESMVPSASGASEACDTQTVLLSLPQADLSVLCTLLATEGLSDNAYALVADVLKKIVAFTPSLCRLFTTALGILVKKLSRSAVQELQSFGEKGVLHYSTSSDGVKRVLEALSVFVNSGKENNVALPLSLLREISTELGFLWLELTTCITRLEVSSAVVLPAKTHNILPYIECFFGTCGFLDFTVSFPEVDASTASKQRVSFIEFCEKHRKLLNAFIRQNPKLLEKSFSLLLTIPHFIDFDNKHAHFRSKIKRLHKSTLAISVRRDYILEDSYNELRSKPTYDLKGKLTVEFVEEEGIDAGGLTREWYQSLCRAIFNEGALLFTTVDNGSSFQPNRNSVYQQDHLSYFKFVGRVVGKALFDGILLDVHFTRSFYKHILGVKVTYLDIEAIDPEVFAGLKWLLENDIKDSLDLTFSIGADEQQKILYERTQALVTDYELIPGGQDIEVTEENKHRYVDLRADYYLTSAIRPQIDAFLEGFNELIPRELVSIFNDMELELLMCGLPDIDLDDMRENTEYSGYSQMSPAIQWFWEVVQGFSREDKARLLQFVTGTSKVPLKGFFALQGTSGPQKFQIHKAYGTPDHLPTANTCFNQLNLPEYTSKDRLQEKLLFAIYEASEGFRLI